MAKQNNEIPKTEMITAIVKVPFAVKGQHKIVGTEMNLSKEDYNSLSEYLMLPEKKATEK